MSNHDKNKTLAFLIVGASIVLSVALIFRALFFEHSSPLVCTLSIGKEQYPVELLTKPREQQRGFMFQNESALPKLFLFSYPDNHTFWMKNVRFPLTLWGVTIIEAHSLSSFDVLFSESRVMEPCVYDPCPLYHLNNSYRLYLETITNSSLDDALRKNAQGMLVCPYFSSS